MLTLIFVNLRRSEEYELPTLVNRKQYRFVGIFTEAVLFTISEEVLACFDKIYTVKIEQNQDLFAGLKLDINHLMSFVSDELQYADHNPEKIRLVSNDEINLGLLGKIRDRFGLPGAGEQQLIKYRDKSMMKATLADSGVHYPKYDALNLEIPNHELDHYFDELITYFKFPMVFKPVFGLGSIGTQILNDKASLRCAYLQAQKTGLAYEVNEYIQGTLYHFNALIQNNKIIFKAMSEYLFPNINYSRYAKPMTSLVLLPNHPLYQRINALSDTVLDALGYLDGVVHLEVFHDNQDQLIFLEVATRPPGTLFIPNYTKLFGINLYKAQVMVKMGLPISVPMQRPTCYYFAGRIPRQKGKVKAIHEPTLKSQSEFIWSIDVGDEMQENSLTTREYCGEFYVKNPDYQLLRDDFLHFRKHQFLDME